MNAMNQQREQIIRGCLEEAPREVVIELRDAAAAGQAPYHGEWPGGDGSCRCPAQRLLGSYQTAEGLEHPLSLAYKLVSGTFDPADGGPRDRQQILVRLCDAVLAGGQAHAGMSVAA